MVARTFGLMAVVLAALGGPALAAGAASRAALAKEARKACAAGRVEQGIELLAQIAAESGDPDAVYNQARCYEQNGRTEQAITRFREYLRTSKDLSKKERAQAEAHIRELLAELQARPVSGAPTVVPPPGATGGAGVSAAGGGAAAARASTSGAAATGEGAAAPRPPAAGRAPAASGAPGAGGGGAASGASSGAGGRAVAAGALSSPVETTVASPRTVAGGAAAPVSRTSGLAAGSSSSGLAAASSPTLASSSPPAAAGEPLAVAGAAPVGVPTPAMAASGTRSSAGRIAAVALAVTGVAGLGTGAFFSWRVKQMEGEIEGQSGRVPNAEFQDRWHRGQQAASLQWVGYGVGAAALVGSGVIYLLGQPEAAETRPAVAARVIAGPRAGGVLVQGRF